VTKYISHIGNYSYFWYEKELRFDKTNKMISLSDQNIIKLEKLLKSLEYSKGKFSYGNIKKFSVLLKELKISI
jgi:hypothetical protein